MALYYYRPFDFEYVDSPTSSPKSIRSGDIRRSSQNVNKRFNWAGVGRALEIVGRQTAERTFRLAMIYSIVYGGAAATTFGMSTRGWIAVETGRGIRYTSLAGLGGFARASVAHNAIRDAWEIGSALVQSEIPFSNEDIWV